MFAPLEEGIVNVKGSIPPAPPRISKRLPELGEFTLARCAFMLDSKRRSSAWRLRPRRLASGHHGHLALGS